MDRAKVIYCMDNFKSETYRSLFHSSFPLRLQPSSFYATEVEAKVSSGATIVNASVGKDAGSMMMAVGYQSMHVLRVEDTYKITNSLRIGENEDARVKAIHPEK